ncbi:MAG: hypothetical protein JNK05_33160 [Myxococcales bacterium]|nr:hypothetical protein [Myxococcales bacterium]
MVVRPLSLSLLASCALISACHEYTPRNPLPLLVSSAASGSEARACDPSPERGAPTGRTPAPSASGALTLIDLVGDDRLAVDAGFFTAWSDDGAEVFYSLARGVARWSVADRTLVAYYAFPTAGTAPGWIAVSRDRRWIAASSATRGRDGAERSHTWLIDTTGAIATRRVEGFGSGPLVFSQDQRAVLQGARRLDVASAAVREPRGATGESIVFADGTRRLSIERANNTPRALVLEDLESNAVLRRFGAVDTILSVAASLDGSTIAFVSNGALEVWDARSLERRATITDLRGARLVSLSPDGARALTETLTCTTLAKQKSGCPSPDMTLWSVATQQPLWRQRDHAGMRWVFSRDGGFLTGDDNRYVELLLRSATGQPARFGQRIRSISPDGRWVLYDDGPRVSLASSDGANALPSIPRTVALAPNGASRVTYSTQNQLRLEGADGCRALDGGRGAIESLWYTSDASALFTVDQSPTGHTLRAVRTTDARVFWALALDGRGATGVRVVIGANTALAQSTDHDEVLRFDARTGRRLPDGHAPRLRYHTPVGGGGLTYEVRDRGGDRVSHLALAQLASDGRTVLSLSDHDNRPWVSLWNLDDPSAVRDLLAPSRPRLVAPSRDDRQWAIAAEDHRVRWVDRQGFLWRDAREAHRAEVVALTTSADGARTASASKDGDVFVYDTASGAVVGRASFVLDHGTHLAFATDAGREVLVVETQRGMRARFALR